MNRNEFIIEKLLALKRNEEDKREKLNNFYVLACSIIFSLSPFINTLGEKINKQWFSAMELLPLMGVAITTSWVLSLITIRKNLESISRKIQETDKELARKILSFEDAPDQWYKLHVNQYITVSEMLVPIIFGLSFIFLIFREWALQPFPLF